MDYHSIATVPPKVLLHRPISYMYTPYSDFTEQEEFAADYRRHIARLYAFLIPCLLFLSSLLSYLFFQRPALVGALFFFAVFFLALGTLAYFYFDVMFDMFSVAAFLNLPVLFHVWPTLPLLLAVVYACTAEGDPVQVALAVAVACLVLILTNTLAWLHSLATDEERRQQWPPLPGTETDKYLHC